MEEQGHFCCSNVEISTGSRIRGSFSVEEQSYCHKRMLYRLDPTRVSVVLSRDGPYAVIQPRSEA